jgi:glycosyltransferase involved in cell wall biosynthesis
MPYQKKVYVRSNNIEVGKFMSPMKLFEYMAAEGVIIASNLVVYNHILNNKNSILIRNNSIKDWEKKIKYYFKNIFKFKHLSKNASKNVKNYTWEKRINKLDKFLNV